MEFISQIGGFGGSFTGYLVPFLFVLTIVVFFHELGHFLVARWCGVTVEVFSIGFGHELFGWTDRRGTRWKIAWIPLGGYVKFLGDANAASMPDDAASDDAAIEPDGAAAGNFQRMPLSHRVAVVAAGPLANFLLAIVIFAGLFTVQGQRIVVPLVDEVQAESAAEEAGFQTGDLVVAIDGGAIDSFSDMQRIVSVSGGQPLTFDVVRGGERVGLIAVPRTQEVTDRFGNSHRIGVLGIGRTIGPEGVKMERSDPLTSLWLGVRETWFIIDRTMSYLGGIIIGSQDADQLGGPLRIAQISGQVATVGFAALINLSAILSVSIGLINLFPVPMLDGGHLLYYGIEAVRGRPLNRRAQEFGFRVGLALVMTLMVFATWNDLMHLQVFEFISAIFS